jgi:hypothetical protein
MSSSSMDFNYDDARAQAAASFSTTPPSRTAIQSVDELIRREHKLPGGAFPDATHAQLLMVLETLLTHDAPVSPVMPSHGTTLASSNCGRIEAPAYYLKRSHGRYVQLCFDQDNGCWEHSSTSNCSYVDQRMDLVEWAAPHLDMFSESPFSLCPGAAKQFTAGSPWLIPTTNRHQRRRVGCRQGLLDDAHVQKSRGCRQRTSFLLPDFTASDLSALGSNDCGFQIALANSPFIRLY